jgi:4-amino-4-deoxy-L-arabinose transferase-like glycosyltransferase
VSRRVWIAALAAYGALLWASAPRWPDDWDGIGFLESVTDFDLARFQPHPPGYPVYVALLRVAAVAFRAPMRAAIAVAVASGVLTVALITDAVWQSKRVRTAAVVGALVAVVPLAWRADSGVGSEAPALACLAACIWGLVACRSNRAAGPWVLGLAVGLGLGVRLSWAPVYVVALALAPRGGRRRAFTSAVVACAAWAVPLLAIVGPSRLLSLYTSHFAGHAERWGGTIVTEPGAIRAVWLARDIFVDALGVGLDATGIAIGGLLVASVVQALLAWRAAAWVGWRAGLVLVLPYLVWVTLGQNLRDQPRHVLPLAAALIGVIGLAAEGSRRAFALLSALAVALSIRTAMDSHARRTIAPPGQQLVELVRAQPSPQRIDVFGVSSIRFFERTELAAQALPAGLLGDVQLGLTRVGRLPARVWLTSEVETANQSRWPLVPVATLCRPPRLDRRAPCLDVIEWKPPFLPAR